MTLRCHAQTQCTLPLITGNEAMHGWWMTDCSRCTRPTGNGCTCRKRANDKNSGAPTNSAMKNNNKMIIDIDNVDLVFIIDELVVHQTQQRRLIWCVCRYTRQPALHMRGRHNNIACCDDAIITSVRDRAGYDYSVITHVIASMKRTQVDRCSMIQTNRCTLEYLSWTNLIIILYFPHTNIHNNYYNVYLYTGAHAMGECTSAIALIQTYVHCNLYSYDRTKRWKYTAWPRIFYAAQTVCWRHAWYHAVLRFVKERLVKLIAHRAKCEVYTDVKRNWNLVYWII